MEEDELRGILSSLGEFANKKGDLREPDDKSGILELLRDGWGPHYSKAIRRWYVQRWINGKLRSKIVPRELEGRVREAYEVKRLMRYNKKAKECIEFLTMFLKAKGYNVRPPEP